MRSSRHDDVERPRLHEWRLIEEILGERYEPHMSNGARMHPRRIRARSRRGSGPTRSVAVVISGLSTRFGSRRHAPRLDDLPLIRARRCAVGRCPGSPRTGPSRRSRPRSKAEGLTGRARRAGSGAGGATVARVAYACLTSLVLATKLGQGGGCLGGHCVAQLGTKSGGASAPIALSATDASTGTP
jgi:hypothetical protein